jgi:sugar O-acyltransferase (sialic acid O-acetyltransferase NeuD family)
MADQIILYGCGSSLIVDFEECCRRNNIDIHSIIDNLPSKQNFAINQEKIVGLLDIVESDKQHPYVIPLFTPKNRYLAYLQARKYGLLPYSLLACPSSLIPSNFEYGVGCFINTGVSLGACTQIGNFVLINRGASIGHHVQMENFVSIGPNATVCGHARLMEGAYVGAGAVILPEIMIGRHAIVGAGAVITQHVNDNEVVIGPSARVAKKMNAEECF